MADIITLIEYDSNQNPIYIGIAQTKAIESNRDWQIKKIEYDSVTNKAIKIVYADGDESFNKIWNDRTTYSYNFK